MDHQLARLKHHREERDAARVQSTLGALRSTCARRDNLMPAILDAVRAYATLGEICGAMRAEFGEYTPPTVI